MYKQFRKNLDEHLQSTALNCFSKKMSYSELHESIKKTASFLRALGVNEERTVTICLPNIPQAVIAFYATNRLGANINMIHPLLPPSQVKKQMLSTNSDIIFILDTQSGKNTQFFTESNITVVTACPADYLSPAVRAIYKLKNKKLFYKSPLCLDFNNISGCKPLEDEEFIVKKESRLFLHSGGTSGEPKIIELSNQSFNRLALRSPHAYACQPDDVKNRKMLMVLPLFHGFGLCICMHNSLIFGAEIVLIPRFQAKPTLKIIQKERTAILIGVPLFYEKLLGAITPKTDLSSVKNIFCGGDTLTESLAIKINEAFKRCGCNTEIMEGYGLTENVTVACVNTSNEFKLGSMGKPLPDVRIATVDENGGFLPPNQEGEIALCTDYLMEGYLNDENETNRAFIFDSEGNKWLRTGDWGCVDSEGFLHFKQRIGRIFKVSGIKVFPNEVEQAIFEWGAKLCAVVMKNDLLTAFVVTTKKSPPDQLKEQLRAHLKQLLPYWCVPKVIEFVADLPLTNVGKIDYKLLSQ